jgi:predicted RNA-binding protein YlxR (DUF448 family)/ribosomal protein L7Ae-like RNA K-turn-binding protein
MVRFVIGPDGSVVPDIAAKLPGRGYWVEARREAVEKAVNRHIFARAAAKSLKEAAKEAASAAAKEKEAVARHSEGVEAKGGDVGVAQKLTVKVDPGLADQLERLLVKSSLGLLGLARRAGQLITGFEKVREALRKEKGIALLHASDASDDGTGKLSRLGFDVREINIFSRDELSLALGRENVVHAALKPGGIKDKLLAEIDRLEGFRQVNGPEPQIKANKV